MNDYIRGESRPMPMKINDHTCPHCGKINDMLEMLDEESSPPVNGDIGICIGCAKPFFFVVSGESYSTRKATTKEESELSKNFEVQSAIKAIKKTKSVQEN